MFFLLGTPTKKQWPVVEEWIIHPQEVETLPGYVEFNKTFEPKRPQSVFPNVPDDVLDLLYRMLDYNPQTRITAQEVSISSDFERRHCPILSLQMILL